MEQGLAHPEEALQNKLVDGVLYADEVESILKEKNGEKGAKKLSAITGKKYRKISWGSLGRMDGEQIAVIYAVGSIVRGPDVYSPIFGRSMGSDALVESVRKARDNKAVKAIILRIDSPGGDGLASDLMWRELRLADKEKPVIASMSDVAASGGYYIAMGCRKIVAEPQTITGSIGVVSAKFNIKGIYDWMQIRMETLQRGKWADMMDESRAMTPEEWERFRQQTRRFYDHFVTKAAESRRMKYETLEPYAQGRVWLGTEARERGLVDELGSLDKAVEIARKEARIGAGQEDPAGGVPRAEEGVRPDHGIAVRHPRPGIVRRPPLRELSALSRRCGGRCATWAGSPCRALPPPWRCLPYDLVVE